MHKEKEKVMGYFKNFPAEIVWADVCERLEESDLLSIITPFDGIICGDDRFTPKVFDQAKNLKVIVKWGTGIDSIDQDYAKKSGVKLYRTPNAFTDPVADSTLAFMLGFSRNLFPNDELMKNGNWDKPQGFALFEKTVGIIGYGRIGQAVAARLRPFGSTVLAYDIDPDKSKSEYSRQGATIASLSEIVEYSDMITLHCDLNQTSHHLLNTALFNKMKKMPIIINTARGPIINESDLILALQEGKVSGAGLDVFEHEPLPTDSPLRQMKNVLLSSHNTNSSPYSWDFVHRNSIKMLKDGLKIQ